MFSLAWTIGRVRGIPVRLHVSLLLVIPLIAMSVARDSLPFVLSNMGLSAADLSLPAELLGLVLAIALFAGIAAHEFGHALVALRQGGHVRQITLMVLGGVTELEHDRATPWQQVWMAFAGPLVSGLLALASGLLSLVPNLPIDAVALLRIFGLMNLMLALFNLIPAYPLDGGRILRGLLALRLEPLRATRIAALVGRGFALVGVALAITHRDPMLLLLSGYIFFGASMDETATRMRHGLVGLRARQAMAGRVATVSPDTPLHAVARHMLFLGASVALVRDLTGVKGVLTVREVGQGGERTASEVLSGPALFAHPDEELSVVARGMQHAARSGAVVVDDMNTILGVVTWEELARAVALRAGADSVPSVASASPSEHARADERG